MHQFACASDIEKAFLMVQLREEDRNYTRFLWFENPVDPNNNLIIFRFRVVLLGAESFPFLLNATIRKHLSMSCNGIYDLKRGLYIDNLIHTEQTESGFVQFFHDSSKVFAEAHLFLKEWISNIPELQTLVTAMGVAGEIKDVNKMLGLGWNVRGDVITKREILWCVSQLFDPLEYMLRVAIRSQIFLQDIWRTQLGWDDVLPIEFVNIWECLYKDLVACHHISFPRQLHFKSNDVSLHLFSDASNKAYRCVVYIVSEGDSNLIAAKARVAPLKNLSVPRLELTAALLSARLAKLVRDTYDYLCFNRTYVWIDSKVILSWLVSNKPLQVYVRNRMDEIRSLLPDADFVYVNTKANPSDLLSRGVSANMMENSPLWWEGPPWLKERNSWPLEEVELSFEDSEYDEV